MTKKNVEQVEQTAPPEKQKKNSWLKRITIAIGVVITLIVILLVSVYFVLRSGSLTQSAVPELNPYLAPFGVELKHLGEFRVDLLKSVEISELELTFKDPAVGDVTLQLGQFDFEFSLADLIDQRAVVNHLALKDVTFSGDLLEPKPAPTPADDEKTTPFDLAELESLLKNPPLIVDVQKISLSNIDIDVSLQQADGLVEYQGVLESLELAMLWEPQKLNGNFSVLLDADSNNFSLSTLLDNGKLGNKKLDNEKLALSAKPGFSLNSQWQLTNNNDEWNLAASLIDIDVAVKEITLNQGEHNDVAVLPLFDVSLKNQFESLEQGNRDAGLKSVFPLKLKSQIRSNLNELKLSEFKQPDLTVSAQIDHGITIDLVGEVDPFNQKVPQLSFDVKESLLLSELDLNMAAQAIALNAFSWSLASQGETSSALGADETLVLTVDAGANISQLQFDKPEEANVSPGIELKLDSELKIDSRATLVSFDDPLNHLVAQFNPELLLSQLTAKITEKNQHKLVKIDRTHLNLTTDYDKTAVKVNSTLDLTGVSAPELKKVFSFSNKLELKTDLDMKAVGLASSVQLDNQELLSLTVDLKNNAKRFIAKHDISLTVSPAFKGYHDAAQALDLVGGLGIEVVGSSEIEHDADNILNANFDLFEQWPVKSDGKIFVTQHQTPVAKDGIHLAGLVELNYALDNLNNYQADISLDLAGVQTPPLLSAIPLTIVSKNNFTWPLSTTRTVSRVDIGDEKAIYLDATIRDKKKLLVIESEVELYGNPAWQKYLQELKELELLGTVSTQVSLQSTVKHPFDTVINFDPERLDELFVDLSLKTAISQKTNSPGELLALPKTMKINQALDWSANHLSMQSEFNIPDLTLKNIASLQNIQTSIQVKANSGLEPDSVDFALQLARGDISLLTEDSEVDAMQVGQLATPMTVTSSASWDAEEIHLSKLAVNIGEDLLAIQTTAVASIDGKNAQVQANIRSRLRENLLANPNISGSGGIEIPIQLTMLDGKNVALTGDVKFDSLTVSADDMKIDNLNGSFSFEEELVLESERVKFRYLLEPNPFQRVDFARLQPYLNTSSISIEHVSMGDKTVGPVLANIYLKQNMFSFQQFDINLFDGHTTGQFYLDVRPGAWKFGLLNRVTHLDPRHLLGADSTLINSELSPINSRAAIEFDIHRRLMEGEIVVSQMSRDQLLQLLDVVDPEHEDEQMAQLRKGLRLSHPEKITITMQQGLMNLIVKVSGLATTIRVTGVPLTPMLQQYAGDAFAAINELPLE